MMKVFGKNFANPDVFVTYNIFRKLYQESLIKYLALYEPTYTTNWVQMAKLSSINERDPRRNTKELFIIHVKMTAK